MKQKVNAANQKELKLLTTEGIYLKVETATQKSKSLPDLLRKVRSTGSAKGQIGR